MEGEVKVDGTILSRRDGMGVYETGSFELETLKDSHILFIEEIEEHTSELQSRE